MAVALQSIQEIDSLEKDCFETKRSNSLYDELVKGMQSAKKGDVYTIDEAWKELEKI